MGQDLQHSASACQLCSILWEGLGTCLENPGAVQWIALRQDGEPFHLQYKRSPKDKQWVGLHFYTKDGKFLLAFSIASTHDPLSEIFEPGDDLEPDPGCSKYLAQMKGWIDSLCIIQGNPEDWKREASHMADVYGNAYVTLAATASVDSRGGLFRQCDILDIKHTVERHTQSDRPTRVNVRPSLEHSPYNASSPYGLEPSTAAPLLERSWCFQEYFLSPRVLSFTQWETLWVCACQRLCNCGEFRENTDALVSESDLKVRFDMQLHEATPKDLCRLWKDVVEVYSLKRLTYDTDRLPALAGIAELFLKKGLAQYVNGLWVPTLLSNLFWELSLAFAGNYGIVAERSTDQSMPSWSWASVSGSFRYGPSTNHLEDIEVLDICYDPVVSRSLVEICAKAITFRGILTHASAWGGTDFKESPYHQRRIQIPGAQEHSWLVDVASELSCDANDPADVYIICGTKGPGLVLRRVEGATTTYRRLGLVERYPPKKDELESTMIQLV
ncbi:hypothetical protein F4818DRAFT_441227 [Hypoxylon cercidicola]|nr:hypothetical protein F4818DRAFT_441227 [Hypoxylon cercidicola]